MAFETNVIFFEAAENLRQIQGSQNFEKNFQMNEGVPSNMKFKENMIVNG